MSPNATQLANASEVKRFAGPPSRPSFAYHFSIGSLATWGLAAVLAPGTWSPATANPLGSPLTHFNSLLAPVAASSPPANIDDDLRLIQGLRERGLWDLADRHCQQRLQDSEFPSFAHADLKIELMRTQIVRASQLPGSAPERGPAWDQVQRIAEDFLQATPAPPRGLLVAIQGALARIAEGRVIAAELNLKVASPELIQRGLEQLRLARKQLELLERDIVKQLPQAPQRSDNQGTLTNEELFSILANLRFQLALANLETASYYGADDQRNRLDLLTSVSDRLTETIGQVDPRSDLGQNARLQRLKAERLMGNQRQAVEYWRQIDPRELTPQNLPSYWEESLDLAAATNEPVTGLSLYQTVSKNANLPPTTTLALLRWTLAMHQRGPAAEQAAWLDQAARWVQVLEQRHPGYWARLGENTLLAANQTLPESRNTNPSAANSPALDTELELLMRTGDAASRAERWDEAVTAYRQASARGAAAERWQQAFEAELKAAQAAEKQKKFSDTARELAALARRQTEHPLARIVHLRALWNWAQIARPTPADQPLDEVSQEFQETLQEHLRIWPSGDSADQARLWLARWQAGRRDWENALETFWLIPAGSPSELAALAESRASLLNWLNNARPATPALDRTAQRWAKGLLGRLPNAPETDRVWTAAEQHTLINLALLTSRFPANSVPELEVWIAQARGVATLQADPALFRELTGVHWVLQITSAAPPTSHREVNSLWEIFSEDAATLKMLWGLFRDRVPSSAPAPLQAAQGQLLQQIRRLITNEQQRAPWDWELAQWELANERPVQAIPILRDLAARFPKRGEIQTAYATALGQVPTQATTALEQWRKVASQSESHTPEWYEAKFQVARLLVATQQAKQAAEMLRYLQAVPPGWEKSERRKDFEQLLKVAGDQSTDK